MKEHPIIFSTETVRAILEGRKTQTRRIIKNPEKYQDLMLNGEASEWCPYGQVGDRLWVKETWWDLGYIEKGKWQGRLRSHVIKPRYFADCSDPYIKGIGGIFDPVKCNWRETNICKSTWRKRPSIHMPKWAARIWLEITNIIVERVQDISIDDCFAEGVPTQQASHAQPYFKSIWDFLNAKRGYGWDKNPYVWVIEFKKL